MTRAAVPAGPPAHVHSRAVTAAEMLLFAESWAYRLGGFVVLNILDDPAWLAMIFC